MCYCTPESPRPYCGLPACKSPVELAAPTAAAATDQGAWMEAMATETLDMGTMDGLVKRSQELWADYEAKKKLSTEALRLYEETEAMIMNALKAAGKTKYHVDGIGTISIRQQEMVRVPGSLEAKKEFFKHLRTKGEEVLFSLVTVNSQTLNAWYRKESENASRAGVLGFSVPGIEGSTMRESMAFIAERKKSK